MNDNAVVEVALRQWAEEKAARRRAKLTFILPRQSAGVIARIMARQDS
jgi:hypothetical protein